MLWPGYDHRHRLGQRMGCLGAVIAVVLGLVLLVRTLGAAPANQAEVEEHLERPILAYAPLDDTAYIVFELDGKVYLDQLVLDWISIEWPPTPRWQWSGMWSYIDVTTAPASAAFGDPAGTPVLFGQINDPAIVSLQVEVEAQRLSYPVSGAGFAVQLPGPDARPTRYRWFDAEGNVVHEVNEATTAGP